VHLHERSDTAMLLTTSRASRSVPSHTALVHVSIQAASFLQHCCHTLTHPIQPKLFPTAQTRICPAFPKLLQLKVKIDWTEKYLRPLPTSRRDATRGSFSGLYLFEPPLQLYLLKRHIGR
jgi:hypothetical protein